MGVGVGVGVWVGVAAGGVPGREVGVWLGAGVGVLLGPAVVVGARVGCPVGDAVADGPRVDEGDTPGVLVAVRLGPIEVETKVGSGVAVARADRTPPRRQAANADTPKAAPAPVKKWRRLSLGVGRLSLIHP